MPILPPFFFFHCILAVTFIITIMHNIFDMLDYFARLQLTKQQRLVIKLPLASMLLHTESKQLLTAGMLNTMLHIIGIKLECNQLVASIIGRQPVRDVKSVI